MPVRVKNVIVGVVDWLKMLSNVTFHFVPDGRPVSVKLVIPLKLAVIVPVPLTKTLAGLVVRLEKEVFAALLTVQLMNSKRPFGLTASMLPTPTRYADWPFKNVFWSVIIVAFVGFVRKLTSYGPKVYSVMVTPPEALRLADTE